MNTKRRKREGNYHEEIYTYKNDEKYDEEFLDIDNNVLRVCDKNGGILRQLNIFSRGGVSKKVTKRKGRSRAKRITTNIVNDIRFMDILLCGDKDSGKTTFLNCISCVESFKWGRTDLNRDENGDNGGDYMATTSQKNKQIVWNYNRLELLSYIPIIFSKLTNRNYDALRKTFKRNFLDTDICQASIFLTWDDLQFINYEFGLGEGLGVDHFDYLKINFCEYGDDLFRKIRAYLEMCDNVRVGSEAARSGSEVYPAEGTKWSPSYPKDETNSSTVMNIVEGAILRIQETKYISYFINLRRSFLLMKSTVRLYRILMGKRNRSRREKTMNIDIREGGKEVSNNSTFLYRALNTMKCTFKRINSNPRKSLFRKKKKLFITINEEHIMNTFVYLNIIKKLNNYDRKDVLFVASRAFDFEKLSKRFHIYFNLSHNMEVFNSAFRNSINRSKGSTYCSGSSEYTILQDDIYYLLKKCVIGKWKVCKRKAKRINKKCNEKKSDVIFKYLSEKKLQLRRDRHKTKCKRNSGRREVQYNIGGAEHGESNNNDWCEYTYGRKNKKIEGKTDDFSFLLAERREVANFFKKFYDEYIYRNQNRAYVKNLVKENFDICFLFIKFCFYHIYGPQRTEEENCVNMRKLNIYKFVYLKQIEMIRKENNLSHYNICVPSCVYVFTNLLKMNYQGTPFLSLREHKISSLMKYLFYAVIHYKLRKRSYDFYRRGKIGANHICYFSRAVIINSLIDLIESRRGEGEVISHYANLGKTKSESHKQKDALLLPLHWKHRRNRKILKNLLKSMEMHMHMQPFTIINSIKSNWTYFKKYMIQSSMCSYYSGDTYVYPDVTFALVLKFKALHRRGRIRNGETIPVAESEVKTDGDMDEDEASSGTLSGKSIHFAPVNDGAIKNKVRGRSILHFPFSHRLLKYFVENIPPRRNGKWSNAKSHILLELLCNRFFKELKRLLMYYYTGEEIKRRTEIKHIFILLNYVMDIYYLMGYENMCSYVAKHGDFALTHDLHASGDFRGGNSFERKRRVTFHLYQNCVLFNGAYFLWEEMKYGGKNSSMRRHLSHWKEDLFFSVSLAE
ncbi:conserved Plasmodium protein, unknown function [Plasmodium knowlesi strain H]|uniref:Uncharacterized protein n=3 Tax=Plasmodium knowlesi TaxID=5850 RepID=A0A5K1U088_PLAKH|nr:conserved Plasmodium protein, unknown function [Plasmodium knowlesi strain H]OTN64691.1 Uncharacterized protein PKNOH_S130174400 [Plasmodium knowlesi]CAA9988912.1 conserved Plasmodium protein, unknown function [Plasmodium knowlesi strain H]SBO24757.1 conserved Plasmodium protein, unknown function [Plasmodium knowlesi strain H]SBO28021.1 conserved Plasmodium protein, unknown function [Plasmodium knowlesi strain H]VVS78386.1 conserved Plasmodium protein, unknown function [Plasmodium knowlesi |eukprot:XP_002261259.1 hypothetical protein, conserved in Plasmodium species [Plasmodium knowlesi strain H]